MNNTIAKTAFILFLRTLMWTVCCVITLPLRYFDHKNTLLFLICVGGPWLWYLLCNGLMAKLVCRVPCFRELYSGEYALDRTLGQVKYGLGAIAIFVFAYRILPGCVCPVFEALVYPLCSFIFFLIALFVLAPLARCYAFATMTDPGKRFKFMTLYYTAVLFALLWVAASENISTSCFKLGDSQSAVEISETPNVVK